MTTKEKLLTLLRKAGEDYVSGQAIGEELHISRSAVSKHIAGLRKDGWQIESRTNAGYRLTGERDALTRDGVAAKVKEDCVLMVEDTVTSTNDLVKTMEFGDIPLVLAANRQTAGRGRLGRRFASPGGTGVYITFGLKPDFAIDQALYVTMATAVAACRAIENVSGETTSIKWVNDIFHRGRKVCGILTEAQSSLESRTVDRLIIGVGFNCFPGSFPPELKDIAGSIADHQGDFHRNDLTAAFINEELSLLRHVTDRAFFDEYRDRCFILGEEITVHPTFEKSGYLARAIDISEDGGLIVDYLEGPEKGERRTIHTGELSVSIPK